MPNSDGAAPQPPQEETPSPSFWAYWCGCLGSQVAEKDKKNAIAYIKNDEHLEYSAYNVEGNEKHALTLEEAMANLPKISRRLESLQKEPTNESEHINIAQNDALINQTIENIQTILIHINDQRYILPIQNAINEATKYLGTKTIPIDIINKLNEACQEAQRLAATGPHYGQSSSANIPGVVYDATQPKEKLEQYSEEELKKIMDNVFKKFNFKDFMTGYDIKIDNETANFLTQFGVEIGVQKGQKVANLSIAKITDAYRKALDEDLPEKDTNIINELWVDTFAANAQARNDEEAIKVAKAAKASNPQQRARFVAVGNRSVEDQLGKIQGEV